MVDDRQAHRFQPGFQDLRLGLVTRAQGHPADIAFLQSLAGKDRPTGTRLMQQAFPTLDIAAFNAHWYGAFEAAVATGVPLKPFALDLLRAIRLPRALVTSSERPECTHKLAITGLDRFFAPVVTLNDVTHAKPHPEPSLRAASLLGLPPAQCLVFEDSDTGAEAAHRAGMIVVQVPDVAATDGRFAHHLAPDLLTGARMAGLAV